MRKRVFFIPTERYTDFNSMIERYEREMRRIFSEKQKIAEKDGFSAGEIPVMIPKIAEPVPKAEKSGEPVPEGTGIIIVEVTTGRGAVPLPGVDVIIDRLDRNDPDGRQELVAIETTDRSGRTNPAEVKTLGRELSLEPGNTGPFSTFYVSASEKGYEPVKSRPVDVFSDEVSILKIDLVPKPEKLSGGGADG